jgi:hypothetical protein
MKAKDLAVVWSRPDSSRLAPKQVSVRLPVHVLARIRALEDLYPTRTRTEIIGDLLSSALDEVAKGLPKYKGKCLGPEADSDELLYEVEGPAERFRVLSNEHYQAIEKEMGNKQPDMLMPHMLVELERTFRE